MALTTCALTWSVSPKSMSNEPISRWELERIEAVGQLAAVHDHVAGARRVGDDVYVVVEVPAAVLGNRCRDQLPGSRRSRLMYPPRLLQAAGLFRGEASAAETGEEGQLVGELEAAEGDDETFEFLGADRLLPEG